MIEFVVGIFIVVYLGMILGGLPLLQLDRTGVALLGAIALIGFDAVSLEEAAQSIHLPTLILLFAFMVVSAQMRLGGFYDGVTRWIVAAAAGAAAADWRTDLRRGRAVGRIQQRHRLPRRGAGPHRRLPRAGAWHPLPFLLALACAANIGSAATLIGNPQNMLIGETLHLSFAGYLLEAALPVGLGLAATWVLVLALTRGRLIDTAAVASREGNRVDGDARGRASRSTPGKRSRAWPWR